MGHRAIGVCFQLILPSRCSDRAGCTNGSADYTFGPVHTLRDCAQRIMFRLLVNRPDRIAAALTRMPKDDTVDALHGALFGDRLRGDALRLGQ